MDMNGYALPPGSRILVTGANGYIASHVVDQLLARGFLVRGTIRRPMPWLEEYFAGKYRDNVFESVIVPSLEDSRALEDLMNDISGVIHMASDLTFSSSPEAVVPWVVKGTTSMLEAAAKQPSLKCFVLASSSSAAYMLSPDPNGRKIDKDSWNETAVRNAWDDKISGEEKGLAVYAASKTEGERQAWNWIRENRPQFRFNSILPCFNVGTILHTEIPGSTMGWTRKLLTGDPSAFSKFSEQWFVDVEDVALLSVIGLLDPTVTSERIFAFGEQFHWSDVVRVLRELRPTNKRIPDAPSNVPRDRTEVLPRKRSLALLSAWGKDGFTPIGKSLANGIQNWE
ncbi:cinnamoyl-CoA reductase [Aspergillus sclerotiicarbonarius CBS 121057]|uniref:Cinnamoyl-CoA reductase n=1 Tax=Aspergillus sclerotiicarbonarius (strain CBS 121057 / IBT 28362) TaxID=1448318 RepID=A0A319E3J2_ASPSB|nr:cinnamoyl-CoA reductase [Aspergillus sclerotiicarbonarius CBS 121057]